ncbi:unnamed protein product [Trifolium pratense]|uniref:Uncharacterized protein n=1 Tax=Trifolium pratense TaxID=57577 RepID=A0ACB0IDR5_TRIPR|nr:unnamed protein product [Trifolium pratense]
MSMLYQRLSNIPHTFPPAILHLPIHFSLFSFLTLSKHICHLIIPNLISLISHSFFKIHFQATIDLSFYLHLLKPEIPIQLNRHPRNPTSDLTDTKNGQKWTAVYQPRLSIGLGFLDRIRPTSDRCPPLSQTTQTREQLNQNAKHPKP